MDVPEAQVLFPLLFNHGSWYTLPKYLVTLLFLLAGGFVGFAFVPVVCGAYFPLLVIFYLLCSYSSVSWEVSPLARFPHPYSTVGVLLALGLHGGQEVYW